MAIETETTVLLRTILFQLETADDLESAVIAVKAMCTKDDVSSVSESVREWKEKNDKNKNLLT